MASHFAILLLIGFVAGIMSGMFGIGGGIIIVPALILVADFPQILANGTSLFALLLPVGIFAVITYYRAKFIDLKASILIALGLMAGVAGGASIALDLEADILKQLYGIFLLYVGLRFIEPLKLWNSIKSKSIGEKEKDTEAIEIASKPDFPFYVFILIGIIAGVMSGLFGIGGGLIIVPVLSTILKFEHRISIGTSLGALLLPVGLPGVILYYKAGEFSFTAAIPVALGLLFGAFFGANIAIRISSTVVRRLYGFFLLIVGIDFILPFGL